MNRRSIIILASVLALLTVAVVSFLCYRGTYVTIDEQPLPREITALKTTVTNDQELQQLTQLHNLQKLDLSDSPLTEAQYETLQAALPNCDILWNVPFQGSTVPNDTSRLSISTLTAADIDQLQYMPHLRAVDATKCSDYEALAILLETYPQLDISYSVTLEDQTWPRFTQRIEMETVDPDQLSIRLGCLPQLTHVTLTEIPADMDAMMELQASFPDITFTWPLEIYGVRTKNTAETLNLADIPLEDTRELEENLKYMPNLTKVDMCNCGISNEEMEALNNRHPDTLFVWIVNIGPYPVRTDITYYIPVKYQQRVGQDDCQNLRYCTELVALDLGHMPIITCEFVSYMPHLKYLIMADSSLTNIEPLANLKELVFLEIFLTYVTDYSPLLSVTSLEDLNICHTHGEMEPLTRMTWLKRLWWGGNPGDQLSDEEHAYLQSCLPNTTLVTDLVYSTGRGWRQGGHYYDMRDYFGMWYMDQD